MKESHYVPRSPDQKSRAHGLQRHIISTRVRTENHYKDLLVALISQQVPVAQRFCTVACDPDAWDSILTESLCFFQKLLDLKQPSRQSFS